MSLSTFILKKIFGKIADSSEYKTYIQFANGSEYRNYNNKKIKPAVNIKFKTVGSQIRSILFFPEGFLESYINQTVDIEGNNPIQKLSLMADKVKKNYLKGSFINSNPLMKFRAWLQERFQDNVDREQAIKNAEFHYALPPSLFEYKLGETVGYSEGYWPKGTKTLNQAKHNNYEYICQKLQLKQGMRVLEVGSGWGFFPIYMVKKYDVDVVIYNPTKRQNEYMRKRFKRHGVSDRIRIEYGTHRDIVNEKELFDRFVSIGVHEHHGYRTKMYHLWWKSIEKILKEGGIGVISYSSFLRHRMTSFLTLKYIWPGGHIPSTPKELFTLGEEGLMLIELENLWPHYQRTVEEWRDRFKKYWKKIQKTDPKTFTEKFRRRWTLYLEGVVTAFETHLDLSHIVFVKGRYPNVYPLTKEGKHINADFRTGNQKVECYQ